MKKKLEAELISIAHRILQLKNRDDINQLQQETLKLYEKLSVLKFVEDNFNGVQPTITHAMAEEKLEEVYHLKEIPEVKANEAEAEKNPLTPKGGTEDKENKGGKGVDTDNDGKAPVAAEEKMAEPGAAPAKEESNDVPKEQLAEAPLASEEKTAEAAPAKEDSTDTKEQPAEDKESKGGEGVDTDADGKAPVAEPEKKTEEQPEPHEVKAAVIVVDAEVGLHENIQPPVTQVPDMPAIGEVAEKDGEDTDNGAGEGVESPEGNAAVSELEKEFTAGTEPEFNRKPEPVKQKEISFEDFHDYKEPEFVKKDSPAPKVEEETKATEPVKDWHDWEPSKSEPAKPTEPQQPKAEEPKAEEAKAAEPVKDWRDWEPAKPEPVKAPEPEQPKAEAPKPATPPAPKFNDGVIKAISLTLNDRIAFEKQLFGGSSDDLNRVISQLNTLNSYEEAQDFVNDLVKPDYNNWAGKEEYEERFMAIVEKKFG